MAWGNQRRPSRTAQVLLALSVLLLVPMSVQYARQAGVKRQWQDAEAQVLSQLATAQALNAALQAEKSRVQTDAYIEEAARERLKYARPGDVSIVIATTPRLPSSLAPEPTAAATPGS